MSHSGREQKLVDLCFEIGLTISDPRFDFTKQSQEERAKWIARQLRLCGFDTAPCGSSYGVLKPENEVPAVRGRTNVVALLDDATFSEPPKVKKTPPPRPAIANNLKPLYITEGATNPPRSR